MYRILLRASMLINTDEAGAVRAAIDAKQRMLHEFGNELEDAGTITVQEWMYAESTRKLPVMARNGQPFVEHRAAHECGHRRRFV